MLLEWQIGKVVDIQQEAAATRKFFIELPATNNFVFEPGQFVTLDLPIHEQKNKRWRSYSIASHPNGTNIFELVIVFLEGGAGTNYLFNNITIGSELTLRGALGKFTLPEVLDKDIYLICTGTGIAPFRSMVKHIQANNIPYKNINLIFGSRTIGDCLYSREMLQLSKAMPNFNYLPCLSREENIPNWATKGYVHAAYENQINKTKIGDDLPPVLFYLCGWKNMVDEAKQRIVDLGFDRKTIHLELYG